MKILESLQDRIPDTGILHRATIVDPDDDASPVSVVLVRVPPQHRFPMHIHTRSEDCFFVLSGDGEVFGPDQCCPITAISGVWVPPGVPHGLTAGRVGVVEIGFQSPPGPTVEFTEPCSPNSYPDKIETASLPLAAELNQRTPEWHPVFTERTGCWQLDPQYCRLDKSQELCAVADGHELLVVVVQGTVRLQERAECLGAIAVIQLNVGEREILHALEANTLLLGIRVRRLG